ncbi:MAG: OmpA family protein [Hyphomicrobiales bacterium]|nr:OmpA family protein [Hyphomicrobiales bacterium]
MEPAIVLAQAPAVDPQTGRPLPKGVQPKGSQAPIGGGGTAPAAGGQQRATPQAIQNTQSPTPGQRLPAGNGQPKLIQQNVQQQPQTNNAPAGTPQIKGPGRPLQPNIQQKQQSTQGGPAGTTPLGKGLPKQSQQGTLPQQQPQTNTQGGGGAPVGQGLPKQIQQGTLPQQQPQTNPQGGGGFPAGQGLPKQIQQGTLPQQQPQTNPQGGGGAPVGQGLPKQIQQGTLPQQQPQTNTQGGGGAPIGQGLPKQIQQGTLPQQQPQTNPQGGGFGQRPGPVIGAVPHAGQVYGGHVDQLRTVRQERREGNVTVIEEPGRRFIVRDGGVAFIRHDETERFRRWGGDPRFERRGAEQFAYITRPGGYQIITVTDPNGRLLRRIRRGPDGREVILLENRPHYGPGAVAAGVGVGLAAGVILGLAAPVINIPRERYIVDTSMAPAPLLYETLHAPPLMAIERPYSIDEIRYNAALRDRMRRVDIDSVTFESGSWEVTPEQQPKLAAVADAVRQVLAQSPNEVFMIEGHTDAVGNDVDNLSLSDRRAEAVAVILTDAYQIPPENLVTQGYGEQNLKVPTDGPSRENRRVTVRRITPLLNGGVASR